MPQPVAKAITARDGTLALLTLVLRDSVPLSDSLGPEGPLANLDGPGRARAQRMAVLTLRNLDRADALLVRFLDHGPPPRVMAILRMATVELCVNGEAAHGVVDSAVALCRKGAQSRKIAGLVNAVLRRVAIEGPKMWDDLPVPELPGWLRRRLIHIYDAAAVEAMEAAHMGAVPLDLTLKAGLDTAQWASTLEARVLPTGSLRIERPVQVTALPGYGDGAWWVQDAAAAVAARLLQAGPGMRVLDLCAAPGGKTLQLASTGADVTALDRSAGRMIRLRQNLDRVGLQADCVVADGLDWNAAPFDAVMLDAPCSATGTIRRHPDLVHVKTGKELDGLFTLQSALLDRAVALTKPGGRIVYCTCSLLAEEGELQIKKALTRHDVAIEPVDFETLGLDPSWQARGGTGLRLRPDYWADQGGMDGFFIAALRKAG